MMKKTPIHPQSGFTLIETLMAMTIGMLLMTTIIGIMYQSARMAEMMEGQIKLNQEAREMFLILLRGGNDTNGDPITGLRGRLYDGTSVVTKSTGRLSLNDVTNGELKSREEPAINVQCTANDEPVTGCAGTGIYATDGLLAKTPTMTADTAGADMDGVGSNRFRWLVVSLDLIDPRVAGSKLASTAEYLDTYSTLIFTAREVN